MKYPKSKRAHRIGGELQKVLAEQLRRLAGERFPGALITVSEVRVSDDLKVAAVYVSLHAEPQVTGEIQKAILRAASRLKRTAAETVRMKQLPELRFVWDDTMERADRIEQLLEQIRNPQSPPSEESGGLS